MAEIGSFFFFLFFPEKEAKSVSFTSRKTIRYLNFGEADSGGLGACPQKTALKRDQSKDIINYF
jgi:hypothetical protein